MLQLFISASDTFNIPNNISQPCENDTVNHFNSLHINADTLISTFGNFEI